MHGLFRNYVKPSRWKKSYCRNTLFLPSTGVSVIQVHEGKEGLSPEECFSINYNTIDDGILIHSLADFYFEGISCVLVVQDEGVDGTAVKIVAKQPDRNKQKIGANGVSRMTSDLVAHWDVPLHDKVHRIEFEHGTTTGKRVIRVDGNELVRREWMFKLVGNEIFHVGSAKCEIMVDSVGAFSYSYGLKVNGKSYKKFTEIQSKALKTWIINFDNEMYRVVLEKDTLDIWANGEKLNATGEFVDDGTETHFTLGDWPAYIKAATSGNRREGIIHHLIVNDKIIPPVSE